MSFPGLQAGVPIVDPTGAPTAAFITYMQNVTTGIVNSSGASMPTPSPVNIIANYDGSYPAGTFPKAVVLQRMLNGDDVSARSRWFLTTVSGSISATIDQGGVITIASLSTNSVLQAKSVRDGVTLTCNVTVNKVLGSVPSTGGGGSATASTSLFFSISSASYADITSELSVTVGSSGTVSLTAPLNFNVSGTLTAWNVWAKWEWWNGASWVDVAAEIESDAPADSGEPGSITVNMSKTGLTVGSTQKFKLAARNDAGTKTVTFNGAGSAIP